MTIIRVSLILANPDYCHFLIWSIKNTTLVITHKIIRFASTFIGLIKLGFLLILYIVIGIAIKNPGIRVLKIDFFHILNSHSSK